MTTALNMLIAVAVLGGMGLLFGVLLAYAGRKYEAPRKTVHNGEVPEKAEKMCAFVHCNGGENTLKRYTYAGPRDCRSASLLAGGPTACEHACLGLGTCERVCAFGAIKIKNGVAEVDRKKCTACKKCISACPRGVIELVPVSAEINVLCSNKNVGAKVRDVCENGCIGCGVCAKTCKYGAISADNDLAVIDYKKCTLCGECAEACPRGTIKMFGKIPKVTEPNASEETLAEEKSEEKV